MDDNNEYNFEKLKSFHIPRKKSKDDCGLLTCIPINGQQFTKTILRSIRSHLFDQQNSKHMIFTEAEIVHNPYLEKEYIHKKRELKDEGHLDKDSGETYGYMFVANHAEAEEICKDGLKVNHCETSSLGRPEMGVYLCKHPDVTRLNGYESDLEGYLLIFKIIKGRVKVVPECRTRHTTQEPTPLYDCHVAKIPADITSNKSQRLFNILQFYLYEYGEIDLSDRPRQALPYVVTKFKYSPQQAQQRSALLRNVSERNLEAMNNSSLLTPTNNFHNWSGKLMVNKSECGAVHLRSHEDIIMNIALLQNTITATSCLPIEMLSRHLPPTLQSKSGKKHNVFYRGKYYNAFTLHPTPYSNKERFTNLLSHLIQHSSAAFVPLQYQSAIYLLPLSDSTEAMGLQPTYETVTNIKTLSPLDAKTFLYAIIVTPKNISTRINDKKSSNVVRVRKRKETDQSNDNADVEEKLRLMNIDPTVAMEEMPEDEVDRLKTLLGKKKNQQQKEKMLHHFYREPSSTVSSPAFKFNLMTRWRNTEALQQEYYIKKDNNKSNGDGKRQRMNAESPGDDYNNIEATFSDDDDVSSNEHRPDPIPLKPKSNPRVEEPLRISNIPTDNQIMKVHQNITPEYNMDDIVSEYRRDDHSPARTFHVPKSPEERRHATNTRIAVQTFAPPDELIMSDTVEELYKHPEFVFTDGYVSSHNVISGQSYSSKPWNETHSKLTVKFSQSTPYVASQYDCPYSVHDDKDIIKSMLRAIHGKYSKEGTTPEDESKVGWVRSVLHKVNTETTDDHHVQHANKLERKIVAEETHAGDEESPQGNSTDSGLPATPGDDEQASLKRIAKILATALASPEQQAKLLSINTEDASENEITAQSLFNAISTKEQEKEPHLTPPPMPMADIVAPTSSKLDDGVDMDICSDSENDAKVQNSEVSSSHMGTTSEQDAIQGRKENSRTLRKYSRSTGPSCHSHSSNQYTHMDNMPLHMNQTPPHMSNTTPHMSNTTPHMEHMHHHSTHPQMSNTDSFTDKMSQHMNNRDLNLLKRVMGSTDVHSLRDLMNTVHTMTRNTHSRTVQCPDNILVTDRKKLTIVITNPAQASTKAKAPALMTGKEPMVEPRDCMPANIPLGNMQANILQDSMLANKIPDSTLSRKATIPKATTTKLLPIRPSKGTEGVLSSSTPPTLKITTTLTNLRPHTDHIPVSSHLFSNDEPSPINVTPNNTHNTEIINNGDPVSDPTPEHESNQIFSKTTEPRSEQPAILSLVNSMQSKLSPDVAKEPNKSRKIKLDRKRMSEAKREAEEMRRELNKHITKRKKSSDKEQNKPQQKKKPESGVGKVVSEIEAQINQLKQGDDNSAEVITKLISLAERLKKEKAANEPKPLLPRFNMPLSEIQRNTKQYMDLMALVDDQTIKFKKLLRDPSKIDETSAYAIAVCPRIESVQDNCLRTFRLMLADPHNASEVLKEPTEEEEATFEVKPEDVQPIHVITNLPKQQQPYYMTEFEEKAKSKKENQNFFYVYNPHNDKSCAEMARYLLRVNGCQFNLTEFGSNFRKEIALNPSFDGHLVRRILPNGNFWIVIRSQDVNMLSSVPHLSLLKTLGSRIQFVVCDDTNDVSNSHNILQGDGGIIVPMSLDALLGKPDSIKNLLAWIISHATLPGNKWKLALHKHIVAEISVARNSTDSDRRSSAILLHDLIKECLSEQIQLPVHDCDDLRLRPVKTRETEEVTESRCICAMKLQLEFVRKYRHIIMLADPNDTTMDTCGTLWRCGVCTTTINEFADFICKKLSSNESFTHELSSVLGLYSHGLQFI